MAAAKSTYQAKLQNRVLANLAARDFNLIEPFLVKVELRVPQQLELPNKPIESVYFIESGIASVVADGHGRPTEVGLIGREGMTGLAIVMGHDRSPNETFIQVAGSGLKLPVDRLLPALEQSPSLHRTLLRYGHAFHIETTQTAVTNVRCRVEERLARWLLMAHDRIDGDEIFLTHEFLSLMIGVRRASITETLRKLADQNLIAIRRGAVAIVDRTKLQKTAKGAYTPLHKPA